MKQHEIESGLKKLGLKKDDIVFLHSSLSSLGNVEGGVDALIDAFLNVLGEDGTLMAPTFCSGIVPETLSKRANAVNSIAPSASVAAIGAQADALCKDHWKAPIAHAKDTPYMRLVEHGGYVCLLGVDQDRSTLLHTAEELLRLPYLKERGPEEVETPEGKASKTWKFFPGPHRNFIGLDRLFRESGKMKMGRIGNAVVRLIKGRDLVDLALEAGRKDPAFALCDNPNCRDCILQRADLRRARLKEESFTVVAAASLAGRYIPEMVENCKAAGIDHIELDAVQGQPIQTISREKLVGYIKELSREGVKVTALRPSAVTSELDDIFQAASESGVNRVVLPLTSFSAEHLKKATEKGVSLSFGNTGLDTLGTVSALQPLKESGQDFGLAFNCAQFVCAGEKPFSGEGRPKLARIADQLDLEDCTWDGTPQPLACGNGEVKEMLSILRCASFSGYVVLGSGNRWVGDLRDAAKRFMELLESL